MAPSSEIVLDKPPTLTTPQRHASEHRFYVAVGILVGLICIVGFGPSIIEPAGRNVPLPMTLLGGIVGAPIAHLVGHYPALQVGGSVLAPLSNLVLLSLVPIHDRLTMGRIHPVSLWGAIGSFAWLFLFFTLVAPTSMWRTFTLWVIQ